MLIEILVFIITSLLAYVWYVHKTIHWKFDEYGVKYLPGVPLFGNIFKAFIMKQHVIDILKEISDTFPEERYFGYIEGMTPVIMIRDLELIKNITIKDFDHFVDHKPMFPVEIEPLLGESVFMMKGDRWRDMRATLSPAFTGSKMRQMMPYMDKISEKVVRQFKEHEGEDIDIAITIRRFTNDVIASAGLGLEIDSIKEPDNSFYRTVRNLFFFGYWQRAKFIMMFFFPAVLKAFGLNLFQKEALPFFTDLVKSSMDFRKKNNVHRPDIIQLLMDASKGNSKVSENDKRDENGSANGGEHLTADQKVRDWTLTELTSQVYTFFLASFDASAGNLVFTIHELAIHPDIQERLYQEISDFKTKNDTLTFDNLKQLKYLDCVINESLRKWAPAILDRACTKAYELPPPHEGGKPYPLQPGDILYNAPIPIHFDPRYFPEPEKFNPDRFLDESKIQPFTFMPFGLGPRNCVGSRFAVLEAKVLLYHLLLSFKIVKCAKTSDPLIRAASEFHQRAVGGSWVKLEARA